MTIRILENFHIARAYKGSLNEKLQVFSFLNRWKRKLKVIAKENEVIEESFFKFKFFSSDYWTINFLFNEIFIAKDYFFETESKEPVIIDCGSNIGMSVLYFKNLYPLAKIIAFEPNPNAFKLLKLNVEQNKLSNVDIRNTALYDEEKELSFFIGNNVRMLKGSVKEERGGNNEIKIRTQKLSDVFDNYDRVDLVKMDVEGAELKIISDLYESGKIGKAEQYIIEYHHNLEGEAPNLSSFLNKFESNGYGYNIRTHFKKTNSFQDILIHFYRYKSKK